MGVFYAMVQLHYQEYYHSGTLLVGNSDFHAMEKHLMRRLDRFDMEAIAEGQALSDARKMHGRKRRFNENGYRYRTQMIDAMSDNMWRAMIRKAAESELWDHENTNKE